MFKMIGCFFRFVLILIFIAAIAFGTLWVYERLSEDQKDVVRDKVEEVSEKVQDKGFWEDLWDSFNEFVDGLFSDDEEKVVTDYTGQTEYAFAGLPQDISYPGDLKILMRKGYVVGYDETRNDPAWVSYSISGHSYEPVKRPSKFATDKNTSSRVTHGDYTGTGYDRGHMAPNYGIGVSYGGDAQMQTFLMSNIIPQTPSLNRGPWKELEQLIANDYYNKFGQIWVVTGPVFGEHPKQMASGVVIPDACYKIVMEQTDDGQLRSMAFLMPQNVDSRADPVDYLTTIDSIEEITGLDFLSDLPDPVENDLEDDKAKSLW